MCCRFGIIFISRVVTAQHPRADNKRLWMRVRVREGPNVCESACRSVCAHAWHRCMYAHMLGQVRGCVRAWSREACIPACVRTYWRRPGPGAQKTSDGWVGVGADRISGGWRVGDSDVALFPAVMPAVVASTDLVLTPPSITVR